MLLVTFHAPERRVLLPQSQNTIKVCSRKATCSPHPHHTPDDVTMKWWFSVAQPGLPRPWRQLGWRGPEPPKGSPRPAAFPRAHSGGRDGKVPLADTVQSEPLSAQHTRTLAGSVTEPLSRAPSGESRLLDGESQPRRGAGHRSAARAEGRPRSHLGREQGERGCSAGRPADPC